MQNFSPEELIQRREAAGLKRTQLAALVDRSERTVQEWEKGTFAPPPSRIGLLAAVLGCELADLFADDGRPDPALEYRQYARTHQPAG